LATAKADSGRFPRKSARIRLQRLATGFRKPIGPREFAFAEAGS